jgi:hypothetical protein
MKKSGITFLALLGILCLTTTLFGQENKNPAANEPKATDLAKTNSNHQLLAELAGTWNYKLKIRTGPDKWTETNGIVVRQPIMNGRYFLADFDVEMLPGADGKLEKANFKGKSIEGYDNAKQKFVSIWIDNASTGITTFEGTYDPASRTFTYNAETEAQPGKITKVRELITVADSDHYSLTWLENHGGHEVKTVEINYTRKT